YEGRGYYAVNLTIVDNDEKSSSVVKYVPLGYPPKAVFFTSPVGYPVEAILPGQIITFNASLCVHPENLNITSYEWDFGDGNVTETTDPVITHSYAKRGLYRIKLTAKDLDGLPGSTVKEIQVGIPPLARFTFDPARPKIIDITQGVEITFDASESQGGEYGTVPIVRFVWNFDDGFIEETNVTQIKHPYYSPGNWNVTLTVYDADGLRHSFSQIVSVTYEPPLGQSGFPLHILALIIIIAIIVAVVIVRRKRAKEEEEALEI
ncbi:MAG: PKD domain-containing protein, partial [Candidatus Bathyarchaeia archaeon]